MGAALAAIKEHSLRLLAAVRSGTQDDQLAGLLDARKALLAALAPALARGERAGAAEISEIQDLETAIQDALQARRDAVSAELAALRRGRAAGAAYGPVEGGSPRFVDRAG